MSLLIGYPVAYFLARKTRRFRLTLLMLVILPLWTSYLVRTYAWMLILGTNGVINQSLQALGLIERADQLAALQRLRGHPRAGPHLRAVPHPAALRGAGEARPQPVRGGARTWAAAAGAPSWHVTLPLSLPGVATGCLFVFIPSMGAFVTPELLGGTRSILIGSIVAQQFGVAFEYPFGSAMSLVIMAIILLVRRVALLRPAGRRGPPDARRRHRDRRCSALWTGARAALPVRAAGGRGRSSRSTTSEISIFPIRGLHAQVVRPAVPATTPSTRRSSTASSSPAAPSCSRPRSACMAHRDPSLRRRAGGPAALAAPAADDGAAAHPRHRAADLLQHRPGRPVARSR